MTPTFEFTHEPEENADRAYVLVDGAYDVAIIRNEHGLRIEIYPKDWIDPIDGLRLYDSDVEQAASADGNKPGQAATRPGVSL